MVTATDAAAGESRVRLQRNRATKLAGRLINHQRRTVELLRRQGRQLLDQADALERSLSESSRQRPTAAAN